MFDLEKLKKSMTNIKPNEDQIYKIKSLRESYKFAAEALGSLCKDSRELSIAVTNLEQSLMWAVKSIVLED